MTEKRELLTAIITMHKYLKENMNITREMNNAEKNKMQLVEIKNTVCETNILLDRISSTLALH